MAIRQNILGYHCNDIERCQKFVNSIDYLIIYNDINWLGKGMYFWDNISNAWFWVKKKKKDDQTANLQIVTSNIFLDKMLDLTDSFTLDEFGVLWNEYMVKTKTFKNIDSLGVRLDILFDYFKLHECFPVVKVYGKYPNTPKPKGRFIISDYYNNRSEPSYYTKIIYSVKDPKFAVNRQTIVGEL